MGKGGLGVVGGRLGLTDTKVVVSNLTYRRRGGGGKGVDEVVDEGAVRVDLLRGAEGGVVGGAVCAEG